MATAGEIIKAIELSIEIARVVREKFELSKECFKLAQQCDVIQDFLEKHEVALRNQPIIAVLQNQLEQIQTYLMSQKTWKLIRNPICHVSFQKKIPKYRQDLADWVMRAIISINGTRTSTVCRQQPSHNDFLAVATKSQGLSTELSFKEREELLNMIPKVEERDICDLGPHEVQEFRRTLNNGEKALFKSITLTKWDVPRALWTYSIVSRTLNVQRFFGIFRDSNGSYAVMEDLLQGEPPARLIRDAFSDDKFAHMNFDRRLRLCYEIAVTVAYLHSLDIIVRVISETNVLVRRLDDEYLPVLTNLEQVRKAFTQSDDYSHDTRYNPPEYQQQVPIIQSRAGDIWSLGILFLQILTGKRLTENFTSDTALQIFGAQNNREIQYLIGDCLSSESSQRPKAFEIVQRFLDNYNDTYLRSKDSNISALLERLRKLIHIRRSEHSKPPNVVLSEDETRTVLELTDSWDDPGSELRLAPLAMFLIGAGLVWGLLDINHIPVQTNIVSRGPTSSDVYKYKAAIYYLTEALEMGYYDASFELAEAHSSLARWHGKHGGLSVESFIRDLGFAKDSFEHDLVGRSEQDAATRRSRDRLLKTLQEAPEWIECQRSRLLKLDPNFLQGDEEMMAKLGKLIDEFNGIVAEQIRSHHDPSTAELDGWNFSTAKITQEVVELLVQMYQRQHQSVPFSRLPSLPQEFSWKDSEIGSYQGQWLDNKRHGHGCCKYKNGERYDGEWEDGKRHGLGVQTWPNGDVYDGDWENDHQNGYGTFRDRDGEYRGQWDNDKRQGWGIFAWESKKGTYYQGEWNNGIMHGWGKWEQGNEESYKGEWVGGRFQGHGLFKSKDGWRYDGEWSHHERSGQGTCVWMDKSTYVGEWRNDKRHGYGTSTCVKGKYEGLWENDIWSGKGTLTTSEKAIWGCWEGEEIVPTHSVKVTWPNGDVYEGGWENGHARGEGTYMYKDGTVFQGKFWCDEDRMFGEGTMGKRHGKWHGFPPKPSAHFHLFY